MALHEHGFSPEHGVDQITRAARPAPKASRCCGLETLDEQLALLDGLAAAEQREFLRQALDEYPRIGEEFAQLMVCLAGRGRRGPRRSCSKRSSRAIRNSPKHWSSRATAAGPRRSPGCSIRRGDVLVVVGALHLVGKQGLPALLEAARLHGHAALSRHGAPVYGGDDVTVRGSLSLHSPAASIRRCAPSAASAASRCSSVARRAPRIEAEDGRRYIDYVGSWGPMIARPRPPRSHRRRHRGASPTGCPSARRRSSRPSSPRRIQELVPSIELVRMVSSGTEATMSAIRLARGYTGRERIVKFEGCYHGHADSLLVKAGSGRVDTRGADLAWRARRPRRADDDARLQRRGRPRELLRGAGPRDRLRQSSSPLPAT